MTLLRYARSGFQDSPGLEPHDDKRRELGPRSRRRHTRSRSAQKRRERRSTVPDYATTIVDPPRRHGSFVLVGIMFAAGVLGLGLGSLRIDAADPAGQSEQREPARLAAVASAPALEVLPPLADTEAAPVLAAEPLATDRLSDKPLAEKQPEPAVKLALAKAPPPAREVITDRVRKGESLSVALSRHGVSMETVNALVSALRGKVDLRGIRAGDVYALENGALENGAPENGAPENGALEKETDAGFGLDAFEFRPKSTAAGPVTWRAERDGDGFKVKKQVTPVTTKVVALGGEVSSSLYVALRGLGEGSTLVSRFVDVFAWDIDFYRETQKGDSFKVIVEKKYAGGRFVGYGRVLAAEYENAGRMYRGFAFSSGDENVAGYFDEDGNAREKTFLKSPLEVALITSSYGQRFHPILRRQRAHNGVDYGAGRGTPFWSVADGVVKEAHYSRTAGNMIVIRHMTGYETEYFHASRFAPGIKVGARVKQRQVIGYVGSTGRSTGPHLHFGMRKKGHFVDPNKQVFPAAKPVPKKYMDEFEQVIRPLLAELEALEIA